MTSIEAGILGPTTMIPARPDSEGEIRTGGMDISSTESERVIPIKILGDRNPRTGEIYEYHKGVHNTMRFVTLANNQEVVIQQE